MDKKDMYIKSKLQQDNKISNQANEVFRKFEGGIELENNNKPKERKVFKLSLKQAVLAFSSLMIVAVLGENLYAHLNGKPNLYSAIKGLFVKEDKYTASEITVDQTVEDNGIKLTLKTVAMDENVLITKYVAEGEKLANEFYTYPEFEEDMIKVIKIRNVIAGNDIGESGYENYTLKDVTTMRKEIVAKLQLSGITEQEAKDIEQMATEAYTEYIGAGLGHEGRTSEEAQELITQTIAMFESKVASKYKIMISNDTLQDFNIDVMSQKIEKSGNQYIIYNVYNVDTISDLASKFNLNINIEQIGSTKGTWNFSTELEKARLDTRVETIDFYNNNKTTIAIDDERSITVEIKRIVISDFSSVIMIQTNMNELNLTDDLPVPFTYIVRSGNDNSSTKIVGTGNEDNLLSGGKVTDRIILDEVDFNVKHIWVDIYSKDGKYLDFINMPEIRDEKYAKSLELTQSFASKEALVSFKYPGEWATKETMDDEVILVGPEDVDGNNPTITIRKISKEEYENIKDFTLDYGHETLLEKGETTIAGAKGYYGITTFVDIGMYEKSKIIVVENNEQYYYLRLTTNTDVEYSRYEETFNKILETIEYMEPEKSYSMVTNGGRETLKLYEDNIVTISFSEEALQKFELYMNGMEINVKANTEYTIAGTENKSNIAIFIGNGYPDYYGIPRILLVTIEGDLYYTNVMEGLENEQFALSEKILDNVDTNKTQSQVLVRSSETGYTPATIMYTHDGTKYMITTNQLQGGVVTAEIYKEYEEQPENNVQEDNGQQEDNSQGPIGTYNEFTTAAYDSIKEWNNGMNTITFSAGVTSLYKEATELGFKTDGTAHTIFGLNGKIEKVYRVEKGRSIEDSKAMPAYVFFTGDSSGSYVSVMRPDDFNGMFFNINSEIITNVVNIVRESGDHIIVVNEKGEAYLANYAGTSMIGKAPTKDIMYDTIEQYLWYDDELYIIDADRENAITSVEYNQKENGDFSSNVFVKANHPREGAVTAYALVEYNTTASKWEVTKFNPNP